MYLTVKLGNMRKAQEFLVLPTKPGEKIIVQSDKSIGCFNPDTGKGILNTKGCHFPHLNKMLGAVEYQFPTDFVEACKANIPKSGSEIGPGVYVA